MTDFTLAALGWSAHFTVQLDLAELDLMRARLTAVHRDRVAALTDLGPVSLTLPPVMAMSDLAVGDWVLARDGRITRALDRLTVLARRAAGHDATRQLIAANLDTMAVVTSCNADFNPARLLRYLALARAGGVEPLIILTKADLSDPAPYLARLAVEAPGVECLALNALSVAAVGAALAPWTRPGRTLALAGSSGVGKTTLANALSGLDHVTRAIREDDARGRHTTTHRQMVPLPSGAWLIDTPGMRELQLTDAAEGIAESFADVEELALTCRFTNCGHQSEPGCAIRAALDDGRLTPERHLRWQKMLREDQANSRTLAEANKRNRDFGKRARRAMADKIARTRFDPD